AVRPVGLVEERLDGVGKPLVGVEEALEDGGLGGGGVVPAVRLGEAVLRGLQLLVELGAGGFDLADGALGGVTADFGLGARGLGVRRARLGLGDAHGGFVLGDLDAGD